MHKFSNSQVEMIFRLYPEEVRARMLELRELIFSTAERLGVLENVEETLKWGQPSYVSTHGSTFRIDWEEKTPEFYRIFFHCQSSLVPTFRELYSENFEFEGNRAIRLELEKPLDTVRLAYCIELALNYHQVKHLPLLGTEVLD